MGEDGPVSTPTDSLPDLAAPVVGDPDSLLAAAVEQARAAAVADAGPGMVGAHLGCVAVLEDPDAPLAVHHFACTAPAYRGWSWSVSVTRVSTSTEVTVDEVALGPGVGALLSPQWLPWDQRVRAGDLGVGDLMPAPVDDPRIVPTYAGPTEDDPDVVAVIAEIGLGRERIMSRWGRTDAAERWYDGPTGPHTPLAEQAPAHCGTCAFYLPLAGSLRALLGVCGNEYSPSDGRAVAVEHGCGAHSDAAVVAEEPLLVPYDTESYDDLEGVRPEESLPLDAEAAVPADPAAPAEPTAPADPAAPTAEETGPEREL